MFIAGIDASTNKTGVAIMENGKYITHTLIDLHKIKDSKERISKMMVAICEYLDGFNIDKIVMEESMMTNNIATVKMLSQLAGAVLFYATNKGIEIEFSLPTHWRRLVGLTQSSKVKRDVLKAEAMDAVKQEYGLDVVDDVAESILIARSGFDLPKIVMEDEDEI
jgi:Holliday junction resolvasome RuvABC endonuclease subunit